MPSQKTRRPKGRRSVPRRAKSQERVTSKKAGVRFKIASAKAPAPRSALRMPAPPQRAALGAVKGTTPTRATLSQEAPQHRSSPQTWSAEDWNAHMESGNAHKVADFASNFPKWAPLKVGGAVYDAVKQLATGTARKAAREAPVSATSSEQKMTAPGVAYYGAIPKVERRHARQSKGGDSYRVSATSRITGQGINSTFNTKGAQIFKFIGNPTAFNVPEAAWAASNYDQFEITKCTIRWCSGLPTAAFGRLGAAFDVDSFDTAPEGEYGITILSSHKGFSETHMFVDHEWHMPAECRRRCWTQLLIPGTTGQTVDPGSAADARSTNQFNFVCVVTLPLSGSGITVPAPTIALLEIGSWYVDYDITFYDKTAEGLLAGTGQVDYNASASNLVTSNTALCADASFLNFPTPGAVGVAPGITVDYVISGRLGTYCQWARLLSSAVKASTPSTAGWYPTFPVTACRFDIGVTNTGVVYTTSLSLKVYIVNPDDPTDIQSASISSIGTVATKTTGCNAIYVSGVWAAATGACNTTGSGAAVTASLTVYVDPTGFRYNPSRFVVVPQLEAATGSITANTGLDYSIQFTPLGMDTQVDIGIPHYTSAKQPLTAPRMLRPTPCSQEGHYVPLARRAIASKFRLSSTAKDEIPIIEERKGDTKSHVAENKGQEVKRDVPTADDGVTKPARRHSIDSSDGVLVPHLTRAMRMDALLRDRDAIQRAIDNTLSLH